MIFGKIKKDEKIIKFNDKYNALIVTNKFQEE